MPEIFVDYSELLVVIRKFDVILKVIDFLEIHFFLDLKGQNKYSKNGLFVSLIAFTLYSSSENKKERIIFFLAAFPTARASAS